VALLALALSSLVFAACGSSDDGGSTSASTSGGGSSTTASKELTTVTIALPGALADLAPLYIGEKQGFFADHGLKINPTVLPQGGPAVVPAVLSGKAQFGSVTNASVLLAVTQGIPIKNIAPGTNGGTDPAKDNSQTVALKSSGITRPKDLEGKSVAIISLKGIQELQVDAAVAADGGDYKKVKFLATPPPEMETVLRKGTVQAANMVEPFLTQVKSNTPVNVVAASDVDTMPNMPSSVFIASDKYIEEHPAIVRSFQEAIKESLEYSAAHQEEVRQLIPTFTEIPPEVASKMLLSQFSTTQDTASIQKFIDLMSQYGFIDKKPTVDQIVTPFPISGS
jgi:NitT/TauT family transport system substrate-binding protein